MARALDPFISETLKKYGYGKEAIWDCHGVWVVYHRVLEQIAAKAGIKFDRPALLENNGLGKSVAMCVFGALGDREEWSIGEAAPGNNKNSYPYAMAEKRGKDRVILKLIGLHGLAYSEDEADDFKEPAPAPQPREPELRANIAIDPKAKAAAIKWAGEAIEQLAWCRDAKKFDALHTREFREKVARIKDYDVNLHSELTGMISDKLDAFNPINAG